MYFGWILVEASFYLEYDVGCEGDAHEGSDCLDTVSGLSSGWLG